MSRQETKFEVRAIALACAALVTACGGGGGGGGGGADGGVVQKITFNFPGGAMIGIPPTVGTVKLVATATGGGPVTFSSNTPTICSVSGDTATLLKAGECYLTATQAGGNGFAPASTSQLFVVPKNPQVVTFSNPGWQPLDSKTVTLAATSNIAGHPVAFTSTTPTFCTVSGNTLTKVADGLCSVTAAAAGDDTYETASKIDVIPIGTAKAPELTFLSGYKDGDTTNEGGGIGHLGNWWWCDSCDKSNTSTSFSFTSNTTDPAKALFWIHAAGLKADSSDGIALNKSGPTNSGPRIDSQGAMKFNLAQNAEWFASANNAINIELILGHFNMKAGKACNVTVKATLKPTASVATDYNVPLKDNFAISESCGLTGLDTWAELQAFPISMIRFSQVAPINGSKMTLSGKITFQ